MSSTYDTKNEASVKLKSSDLDDGLKASGSNHKYQYFLMFILFFVKIVTDSFYAPLPYFLMDPKIKCYDNRVKKYSKICKFSEMCKHNKENISKPDSLIKYQLNKGIDESFSWVTGFNIYCDYFKIGILASSASIGNLLSNIICPLLTENIGRKNTLTITLLFGVIFQSLIFLTTDTSFLFIILLMMNLTNNTVYNTVSIYLNEMVDSEKRGFYSCWFNSLYGISGIIFTIVFNLTFNWKILQIVTIGAGLISFILNILFMKESIRYLFQKDDHGEIISVLHYISKFNGREEKYLIWKESINCRVEHNKSLDLSENRNDKKSYPISLIFKKKTVIYNFITFSIVSLVTISGIIYNAMEIKTTKDTFLFPIIFYFTDFVIIITIGFIIDLPQFGRKLPAIFFSILGGIFYILKYFAILNYGEDQSNFWIDYFIRLCVSISFNILIEYNLEIYSTDIRSTAYNINKLFSRVGDFSLPFILALDRKLATALMGAMYLFMSMFIVKLKETRGMKLKENIDDNSEMIDDGCEDKKELLKEEDNEKI